jgi:hypothetical protein
MVNLTISIHFNYTFRQINQYFELILILPTNTFEPEQKDRTGLYEEKESIDPKDPRHRAPFTKAGTPLAGRFSTPRIACQVAAAAADESLPLGAIRGPLATGK